MNYGEPTPKSKVRLPYRPPPEFTRVVYDRFFGLADEMLTKISVPLQPMELYNLLILPGHFHTMLNASYLMEPIESYSATSHIQLDYNAEYFDFSVIYYNSKSSSITNFLFPATLNEITPDNKLGEILIPIIDMAIQWETSAYLLNRFFYELSPGMTMHMLPWLRMFLHDLKARPSNSRVINTIDRYLGASTPQYIPGVSTFFSSVCKYGTGLLTASKLLEGNYKPKDNTVIIIPNVNHIKLIEDGVVNQFEEFLVSCTPPLGGVTLL